MALLVEYYPAILFTNSSLAFLPLMLAFDGSSSSIMIMEKEDAL
ncbi:MAG: hypothetical protein ACM3MD_00655 [Betaproteobacteria bacterium]